MKRMLCTVMMTTLLLTGLTMSPLEAASPVEVAPDIEAESPSQAESPSEVAGARDAILPTEATLAPGAMIPCVGAPRPIYSTYTFPSCRKSCYTPRVRLYRPYMVGYGSYIWRSQSRYGCCRH
jgi:hypothetical protein